MQVQHIIPKVLFILNKFDLLLPSELEKMKGYNLRMLSNVYGKEDKDMEIIPVSVRDYFLKRDSEKNKNSDPGNIKLLIDKIEQRIGGSRDEILLNKSKFRLHALADELLTLLKVKSDTLQMPLNELELKKESMQGSVQTSILKSGNHSGNLNSI